ncbi:MAG: Vitamin B12 transporter BtuB [uncultured Sulfurimonas sp.]|nr:MAG: Vitamin B12 transporter BtuB [uncultured Sulfurimonas sp.]
MKNAIKLSILSCALLSQLQANEITLKPFKVTSTAIKTDELKSTDAVEVYTQEDIEKAHVRNIYEFLNEQTSVSSAPNYGNPFTQQIDIHGYGSSNGHQNIIITIDGRKINNIDLVPQLLSSIAPSSIKKIEIIKSSGIVIGGDGANAGMINIITKQDDAQEVSFYMGTYGLADGSFYVGHKTDTLSISVTGEAQKSDGIRKIDTSDNKDANSQGVGSFHLAYTPTENLELRAGASFSKSSVIYAGALTKAQYDEDPTQMGNATSNKQAYDTRVLEAGVSYFISDEMAIKLDAANERKTSNYDSLYTNANVYNARADYVYNSAKISFEYDSDVLSLVTGVDIFNGERDSSSYSDFGFGASTNVSKTSKNNIAAFLMSRFNFGSSSIKAGIRHEQVSYEYSETGKNLQSDHSLNGAELGYNYTLDNEKSLFVNYAHAYQAPDIDRFFSVLYPAPSFAPIVGFNEFIEPMISDTITLGYNQISSTNKFKISIYYVALENEIYLEPVSFKNTNLDKSYKYGLDLYDKYIITSKFNIAVNYNYVQAIIDEEKEGVNDYSGKKLPGVSDHTLKAVLSYLANKNTSVNLSHVFRSEAYAANDFNNNFSQKQDATNSTNISATYAKDNWEIFAKINNLFDQKNGLWIRDDAIYPINFTTTALAGFKLKY